MDILVNPYPRRVALLPVNLLCAQLCQLIYSVLWSRFCKKRVPLDRAAGHPKGLDMRVCPSCLGAGCLQRCPPLQHDAEQCPGLSSPDMVPARRVESQ
eukprot:5684667-Amphidinium_carterae.1